MVAPRTPSPPPSHHQFSGGAIPLPIFLPGEQEAEGGWSRRLSADDLMAQERQQLTRPAGARMLPNRRAMDRAGQRSRAIVHLPAEGQRESLLRPGADLKAGGV
eukprot:364663-Chlamydomonas_euryale.AAC.5